METFYKKIDEEADIEQGDIFLGLPFLSLESNEITEVISEREEPVFKESSLLNYKTEENIQKNIISTLKLAPGIIITQNCDALRSEYVSFCAIKPFEEVAKEKPNIKFLTRQYKEQHKYFYLPDLEGVFSEKMAIDFSLIHQVRLDTLKSLMPNRIARLSDGIPMEHFKVKLSHYFKRFAYDSWYTLNKSDFEEYLSKLSQNTKPEELARINPYDWQL